MTYISVDVETSGLIPGFNSLLSVGAVEIETGSTFHFVAASVDSHEFDVNWDKDTSAWWRSPKQENARKRLNDLLGSTKRNTAYESNLVICADTFIEWLSHYENPFFVAWPASFDYPYIQHLFLRTGVDNPFNYRTIDIKSYLCGKLNIPFEMGHDEIAKEYPWLYEDPEFPHDALSDALQQARVFDRLLND